MRYFPLLKADEIECRVAEVDKQGRYISLLLYKTARTDAARLDEKFGICGWQNDYKLIDGKMYCGIGILDQDTKQWVWKWNVGTESNTEAEKGQASDAMKRAGFVWGIGTELYSSPRITIWNGRGCEIKESGGKYRCHDRFDVKSIFYDADEKVSSLTIVNEKTGEVAFSWSRGKVTTPKKTQRDGIDPQPIDEPVKEPMATDAQKMEILAKAKQLDKLLAYYKVSKITDLTMAQAEHALQILERGK